MQYRAPGGHVIWRTWIGSRGTASTRIHRSASKRGHGGEGQSLVELALILPVLLLLGLIAIDFGRVYLGWINLQNMARIAANFAANNPEAWVAPVDTVVIDQYENQILEDAQATNCGLNPATPPSPTFTDTDLDGNSHGIGDRVQVSLTCRFNVITPIIGSIVGGQVNVSATSVFPVKSAISDTSSGGGGGGCLAPSPAINANPKTGVAPLDVDFTDSSGGGAGVSWLWNFGDGDTSTLRDPHKHTYDADGSYTVTLAVTNACGTFTTVPGTVITVGPANPPPGCLVPSFNGIKRNAAQNLWDSRGFTTTVQNGPGAPNGNGWTILSQNIVASTTVPCSSTIQVNNP